MSIALDSGSCWAGAAITLVDDVASSLLETLTLGDCGTTAAFFRTRSVLKKTPFITSAIRRLEMIKKEDREEKTYIASLSFNGTTRAVSASNTRILAESSPEPESFTAGYAALAPRGPH